MAACVPKSFFPDILAQIEFNDPDSHKRETTLPGSRNATREDFEPVMQAMRDGRVPTDLIHTHSGRPAKGPTVFSSWMEPSAHVIKAIASL